MRKIWQYLINHLKEDFHFSQYSSILVFISVCIYLNYLFDFEDSFIDTQKGFTKFLFFFLSHCVAYFIPIAIGFFLGKKELQNASLFWIKSLLALALLSLDRSMLGIEKIVYLLYDGRLQYLVLKVANNIAGITVVLLPLYFFYRVFETQNKNFYGLAMLPFDKKPYILLLSLLVPFIVAVSFMPSFQLQYPMFKISDAPEYTGVALWIAAGIYELAYSLNFVSIEFFYRGFIVLGMVTILGRSAILPMACLYCFLHFGKPMAEAISSLFGGYILGVIAYETRSIWGGIMLHIGIAWMMEVAAVLQITFKKIG